MAWAVIARQELHGLWRGRLRKTGLVAVGVVFLLGGYILPLTTPEPTTSDYASYMTGAVSLLVPLFGLLLGYKAIVADRTSGRLTLLLTLPHSRRDTVLGKYAARSGALTAVLAIGILAGVFLTDYPFGSLDPVVAAGYLFVTLLYGLTFLGIGFAISTLTTSNRVATAATFGVFVAFVVLWPELRGGLYLLLEYLGLAGDTLPDWALLAHGLEPTLLYDRIITGYYATTPTGPYHGPDAAWYLGPTPALLALTVWCITPLAIGYTRFQNTDL